MPKESAKNQKERFLELWNREGDPKEKALQIREELGMAAGELARELLGLPPKLFLWGGVIPEGSSLSIPEGDYEIPFDIMVESGGELVVSPGATLRFAPGKGIISYGLLRMIGNPQKPIRLLPEDLGAGWAGVRIEGREAWGSVLSYCEIEGGRGIKYDEEDRGEGMGGGLVVAETHMIKLERCSIRGCKAEIGGGILAIGVVDMEVVACDISDNRANTGGGMAAVKCVGLLLEASLFAENQPLGPGRCLGGGLYAAECETVTLEGCQFKLNSSEGGGGAALVAVKSLELRSNLFWSNEVKGEDSLGGGLALSECEGVRLSGNSYAKNVAAYGGGLGLLSCRNLSMLDESLSYNTAHSERGEGKGGGMAILGCRDVSILEGSFSINYADHGGGILAVDTHSLTLRGTSVKRNSASGAGGGIGALECESLAVEGGSVEANTGRLGGGLYLQGSSDVSVVGVHLDANQASLGAAAVHAVASRKVVVDRCEVSGNLGSMGGVMYLDESPECAITGSIFRGNVAAGALIILSRSPGCRVEANNIDESNRYAEGQRIVEDGRPRG